VGLLTVFPVELQVGLLVAVDGSIADDMRAVITTAASRSSGPTGECSGSATGGATGWAAGSGYL
jgi:hypothetical protein